MSNYDELIRRATNRLDVDRELQLDVAHELRAHLEDSAAEFRQGGYSPDEAAASAAKALGDPDELAESLLVANRFRMRIRGILRWAARLMLLPAAILVVVLIAGEMAGPGMNWGVDWQMTIDSSQLTEEELFILQGDPNEMGSDAKSISDRWPDNPIYYGNYLIESQALNLDDRKIEQDPDCIEKALSLIERGKQIDPGNAFYDYMSAVMLLKATGEISEDATRTYERIGRDGTVSQRHPYKFEITDSERFARVLAEFRNGLTKTECSGRSLEMMELRLGILPQPNRLADLIQRTSMQVSVNLPPLNEQRTLAKALCGHAMALAEQGDPNAIELIRSVRVFGLQLGSQATSLIELLVAVAIEQLANNHAPFVYEELGQEQMAADARQQAIETASAFHEIRNMSRSGKFDRTHSSMLGSARAPSLPGYEFDDEPLRRVELAAWMQFGLVVLLGLLVAAGVLTTLRWWLGRLFGSKGLLIFIGWGRIAKICLWSVIVPLGIYGVYAGWQIFAPNAYGLSYTFGRVCLEMAVMIVVVFVLLRGLSYSAIRRRAQELGMEIPPPIRFRNRAILGSLGILLLLTATGYVAGWWAGPFRPADGKWDGLWADSFSGGDSTTMPSPVGITLAGVLMWFLVGYCLRDVFADFLGPDRHKAFRATFRRSVVPILASAVIAVGVICGGALAWSETSSVRQVEGGAVVLLKNEIDKSDYRLIKQRHQMEYEKQVKELSTAK